MIGLGIVTYQRPDYFSQCVEAILKNAINKVDVCFAYNDGSKVGDKEYRKIYKTLDKRIKYRYMPGNKGVAVAKNYLLRRMMDAGCDYMFIIEDDILIKSPKAITEYVRLSKESGIEHFLFAHHGTENEGKLYLSKNGVELYTACIGAYCMYTRRVINKVGYFDENFKNAFEHVEHTYRIAKAGFAAPWPVHADLKDSRDYLEEIPDSIDHSSIRVREDWLPNIYLALDYWNQKDKDFPYRDKLQSLKEELGVEYV